MEYDGLAKPWGKAALGCGSQRLAQLTESQDERRMATFSQYALAATAEALSDAAWAPEDDEGRDVTVSLQSRICNKWLTGYSGHLLRIRDRQLG